MKLTDNILRRYGTDKVIHFLVGALISMAPALLVMPFLVFMDTAAAHKAFSLAVSIGAAIAIVLGFTKELAFDDEPDGEDVLFTVLGAACPTMVISLLFAVARCLMA